MTNNEIKAAAEYIRLGQSLDPNEREELNKLEQEALSRLPASEVRERIESKRRVTEPGLSASMARIDYGYNRAIHDLLAEFHDPETP